MNCIHHGFTLLALQQQLVLVDRKPLLDSLNKYLYLQYTSVVLSKIPSIVFFSKKKFVSGLQLIKRQYHNLQYYTWNLVWKFSTAQTFSTNLNQRLHPTFEFLFFRDTCETFVISHEVEPLLNTQLQLTFVHPHPLSRSSIKPMQKTMSSLHFPGSKGQLTLLFLVKIFKETWYQWPHP